MSAPLRTHNFTADEYHRRVEAGVFHEDDRIQLSDGQVALRPREEGTVRQHFACRSVPRRVPCMLTPR